MEKTCEEDDIESSMTGVSELLGEPAIVINGLPPMSSSDSTLVPCGIANGTESHKYRGFGEWLEGREIRKLFGGQFYNGKVFEFDKKSGWYRVLYEDGDFEDLEWHELEELLLPLDITVSLKTLALKIIKKRQKLVQKSGKNVARSISIRAKHMGGRGKTMDVLGEASLTKSTMDVLGEASLEKSTMNVFGVTSLPKSNGS
ncbi:unnamed protein product [Ilex paraguariensis]|uniref:PTM/DIR17-like Tudor domain-containing protein n=1 Tax=Ilex paraguariensis TaxID=185542 RepID=A0ABC8T5Z5_9AQUA